MDTNTNKENNFYDFKYELYKDIAIGIGILFPIILFFSYKGISQLFENESYRLYFLIGTGSLLFLFQLFCFAKMIRHGLKKLEG